MCAVTIQMQDNHVYDRILAKTKSPVSEERMHSNTAWYIFDCVVKGSEIPNKLNVIHDHNII